MTVLVAIEQTLWSSCHMCLRQSIYQCQHSDQRRQSSCPANTGQGAEGVSPRQAQ